MSLFLSASGLRQALRPPSAWVLVVMKTMADLVLHEAERRKLGVDTN